MDSNCKQLAIILNLQEPGELQPVAILETYVYGSELYFHVLFKNNIVEIIHYRYLKYLSPNLYRTYFRKRHASM